MVLMDCYDSEDEGDEELLRKEDGLAVREGL